MKKKQLHATTLRAILSVTMFVTVAIAATGFYFADTKLQAVATDVSHSVVDANASRNNLQALQLIEKELAKQKDAIAKTNSIVADSQSYQYQNQIIADLNDYAKRAGISITNLDFATASAVTPGAKPATGAPAMPAAPSGVKATAVSVTLANPVNYNNLLTFVRLIEQNLTKMQVSKIGLSKDTKTNDITSDTLTVEVYIR